MKFAISKHLFSSRILLFITLILLILFTTQSIVFAASNLSIEIITWDVIGLDSNDVSSGPNRFPVGARVCTDGSGDAADVQVDFALADGTSYITTRGLTTYTVGTLTTSTCYDAYFEVEVDRNAAAFDYTEGYTITVTSSDSTTVTEDTHELYVEHLISQNRNAILTVAFGPAGGTLTDVAAVAR